MPEFRDVPHVEIRKTDARRCSDASVEAEGPAACLKILRDVLQGKEQESFVILMLDRDFRIAAWREVARGAADHVEVPVREAFRAALCCDARAIVLAHNHPSGDPRPSEEDEALTAAIRQAGALINIPVLDHIIVGEGDRYYSFAEGGGSGPMLMNGPRQGPELDD